MTATGRIVTRVSSWRRGRALLGLVVLWVLVAGVPPASAHDDATPAIEPLDATAATDDKSVSVPTQWWTYTNVTSSQVGSLLQTNGARLTDIEVYSASGNTFTVTMVRNGGAYYVSGWWWYYDQTFAQVDSLLKSNNARLIDIEPYLDNGVIRFGVVMVTNTGAYGRAWSWLAGVSAAQISNHLSASGHRLTDIESYVEGGTRRYAMVAVANTGSDAKSWQWWLNQSPASVASRVSSFGGRITSRERQPDGTYNFIQVKNAGTDNKYWRYYYGLTSLSYVNQVAVQFGARVFDVETYTVGSSRRYDAVMIDNVDAETRRISNLFAPAFTASNGLPRANYGAYVKRVGFAPSTALQPDRRFEPASAIKAVHNLTAMKRVQAGSDSLSSSFVYYEYPSSPGKDACPIPAEEVAANRRTTTMDRGKDAMMSVSDNRTTRGFVLRYGLPAIQATAQAVGMTSTYIPQGRIGCAWADGNKNQTTQADLGRLYEAVANGTQLSSANAAEFFQPMNGGPFNEGGIETAIRAVVQEEADKQGKGSVVSAFISRMSWHYKPGGYGWPCSPEGGCSEGSMYIASVGGRLILPTRYNGSYTFRQFVFARYAEVNVDCSTCATTKQTGEVLYLVAKEQFRQVIASALLTW